MNLKKMGALLCGAVIALTLVLANTSMLSAEKTSSSEQESLSENTQTMKVGSSVPETQLKEAPEDKNNMHDSMSMADSMSMDERCGGMMRMDAGGMVMNENCDELPEDCDKVSEEISFTVRAGSKYAKPNSGKTFGFDKNEFNVPGCSRITIRFINEDSIRHQWMVHGLPKYLYSQGMYQMEVNGPGERTGTIIVPSEAKTYLVHCDLSTHMEKGMKAQLKVNGGDGDLPSIPGITKHKFPDSYK